MPTRQVRQAHHDNLLVTGARVLALMNLIGGLILVNGAWLNPRQGAPVGTYRMLVILALLIAACQYLAAKVLPEWSLHAMLAAYYLFIAWLALIAVRAMAIASLEPALIAVGIYCGYFLTRRAAITHIAAACLSFALATALSNTDAIMADLVPALAVTIVVSAVLHALTRQLRLRTSIDPLTGTLNRAAWFDASDSVLSEPQRGEAVVILMDLDKFKQVNDAEGHAAGDELLRSAAGAWNQVANRRGWLLGRYGGDEFVLLVPDGGRPAAEGAIAELRATHPVSWTAGVAVALDSDRTVGPLVAVADAEMLAHKRLPRS